MRPPTGALLAVAVTAAAALAGCGGGSWEDRCTTTKAGVVQCAPGDRPAPAEITGELLDGGTYDLAQHRGSVVVVNFWGSWCSPCRAEAADLEKTYQATKAAGVTFLGIDYRDDRDSARAFARTRSTYPSIFDPGGRVALGFDVTPTATPTTVILDRQGRTAVVVRRSTTVAELEPLVTKVAAEAANG